LLILFLLPFQIHALSVETGYSIDLSAKSPEEVVVGIVKWALGLLALVACVLVIYGGLLYLTSMGNPEKILKAKKVLTSALIGLIIIMLAWVIVFFIMKFFNGGGGGGGQCVVDSDCTQSNLCCSLEGGGGTCADPGHNCYGEPLSSNFYVVSTMPREGDGMGPCDLVTGQCPRGVFMCTAVATSYSRPVKQDTFTPENFHLKVADQSITGGTNTDHKKDSSCQINTDCFSGKCESSVCVGDYVNADIKFGPGEVVNSLNCEGENVGGIESTGDPPISTRYVDLIPKDDLLPDTVYKMTIQGGTNGVYSINPQLTLDVPAKIITFKTGHNTDKIPPKVSENASSPFPADEQTDTYDACLNTPISTKFTESMLPSSFNDTVAVQLSKSDSLTPPDSPTQPNSFTGLLGLKNWSFGGFFDYFMARPLVTLDEHTKYYIKLYGGSANAQYLDAPLDMCGNPLDGNWSNDIDTEGSPVDDFISSQDVDILPILPDGFDAALPDPDRDKSLNNKTGAATTAPWNFSTGDNKDCFPVVDHVDPNEAFYGVDYVDTTKEFNGIGPDTGDNGLSGDAGRTDVIGKYFLPNPEVTFYDNAIASETAETCFNQDYFVGPPNNPIIVDDPNSDDPLDVWTYYIEGTCQVSAAVGSIDEKIPPRSSDSGKVRVSVSSDDPYQQCAENTITGDAGGADTGPDVFTELSPTISFVSPNYGGPGQYVTIEGTKQGTVSHDEFLEDRGTVWFRYKDPDTHVITDIPGGVPPEADCGDTWTNSEIVTIVPQGFPVKARVVLIQVERTDGKRSNLKDFTVNDVVGPGLCQLIPKCDEKAGQRLTAKGVKFGATRGTTIAKYGVYEADSYGTWSDISFEAWSPGSLINGNWFFTVTKIENNVSLKSNGLSYKIPCNKAPYVEDNGSCADPYPSPSPRPNSKNGCLDAGINIVFKMDGQATRPQMDTATFNSSNIKLFKCNTITATGDQPFDAESCSSVETPLDFMTSGVVRASGILSENSAAYGFRMFPNALLDHSTWYEVRISRNIQTLGVYQQGVFHPSTPMESAYSYHFRTQIGTQKCPIEQVGVLARNIDLYGDAYDYGNVIQSYGTEVVANDHPSAQMFEATPRGPDCQFIDGVNYSFDWVSTRTASAIINPALNHSLPDDGVHYYRKTAQTAGNQATNMGTAQIQATTQSKTGSANFIVDYSYCTSDAECQATCHASVCDLEINRCTPNIISFCPTSGAIGQWVTMTGCMLGAQKGEIRMSNYMADYPDPLICGDTWSMSQVIFQVPNINLGEHAVNLSVAYAYQQGPISCTNGIGVCESGKGTPCCLAGNGCVKNGSPKFLPRTVTADSSRPCVSPPHSMTPRE